MRIHRLSQQTIQRFRFVAQHGLAHVIVGCSRDSRWAMAAEVAGVTLMLLVFMLAAIMV